MFASMLGKRHKEQGDGYRESAVTDGTAYHGKMRGFRALGLLFAFSARLVFSGQASGPPKLRLPVTVRPVRYSIDLHLAPGEDRFRGSAEIDLEVQQPVSTVWLHAKALDLKRAVIRSEGEELPLEAKPADHDLVGLTAARALNPGPAVLTIQYEGEVSRTLTDGAFQQKQGGDWYIFTKFEPVTARRVFPCFDEPSFKTPWQLTLHIPQQLKAFSNTPIDSEENEADAMKRVRFLPTKPLPSYLVAFAVGPFDTADTGPVGRNHIPSRIVVPRGRAPEAAYAASITPKLIAMLEEYFGTPYPYEKLDQIVVPLTTAWGAMENAGLIAYGDFLLSPPEQDTELRQRGRADTMAHEMSHQWFGDLVTTAWWDDIWLNEAFASWLATKLLDEWKPEWHVKADTVRSFAVMRADSLATARKIRQPIEAPGDIANAFDGITYGKGEAVIGMFENYAGPEKFQQAIQLYLRQHAWGNATAANLLAAVDKISGPGIGTAFSSFLNQVGFPMVKVNVQCANGYTLSLEQERFLPAGSEGERDAVWGVPVCAVWGDEGGPHRRCALLTKKSEVFPLETKACPTWFFADSHAAGYYAVSYEPKSTQQLFRRALPQLSAAEAAAALRNIQLKFSSGTGDAEEELTSVAEFARSADAGLARQAAETVEDLNELVPGNLEDKYAQLIRSLYGARARELGWMPKPGESQELRLLRMEIVPLVATRGRDKELGAQASALARAWLKDRHTLDPDMVVPVLSAAAWNGDRAFFELLVEHIKNTKARRERLWIISALRGFRDPEITDSALNLFFGSGIDPRELESLLKYGPRENREMVWDFVQKNFDRLNAMLPGARGIPFGATLPLAAAGFCDARHQREVESFFESRIPSLPGGARNLANAVERIRLCSARASTVEPAVADFLNSYHQTRYGHSDAFRLGSH